MDSKATELLTEQRELGNLTWEETYQKIIEAAKKSLGVWRREKYIEKKSWWWNKELQEAVKSKKEAFRDWTRTRSVDFEKIE